MKILGLLTRSTRRRIEPQSSRVMAGGLKRLGLWICAVLALHVAAMMALEGLSLFSALWLTATTVMTVGYGDLSAQTTAGQTATMVLLYAGGIFVLAKGVGDYTDYRAQVNDEKARGNWRWEMRDHLLVIGTPTGRADQYFARLVDQVHAHEAWTDTPVQLLTEAFSKERLPVSLGERGVVHWCGTPTDERDLAACCPREARAVIVLAGSSTDSAADAAVFDTVDRVRAAGFTGPLVAECVDERNRARLLRAGAGSTIRSLHGFPEIAARAVVAPGAEALVETLFTAEGDECRRYELPRVWRGRWSELTRLLVEAEVGIPLGYADPHGLVHGNPVGREVEVKALFVIVHDDRQTSAKRDIPALLSGEKATRAA